MKNPGVMTRREITVFAGMVLSHFEGWKMEWTKAAPSECLRERRIILIHTRLINRYAWEAKEEVLHEAAHINTEGDRLHGREFYAEYVRLLRTFMLEEQC